MPNNPKVLYKVIRYSTRNKRGIENNFSQPRKVEKELNDLALEGYEVLYAWNTVEWIVLLLCKDLGELSPKELSVEKRRRISLLDNDFNFNQW